MEMSPNQVRTASFRTAKRGYDPDEVSSFLRGVAEALESAQNQSTAMEARARAAVARLQELTAAKDAPAQRDDVQVGPDQAETISRTLLLAQRTADTTVAEAKAEADRLLAAARAEAASTIDSTREMSAMMLEEARTEARTATAEEHEKAAGEVQSLRARRDFLEADVDHLERFLADQRARLREASSSLLELAERVPGGLGETRRPVLSAADEATDRHPDPTDEEPATLPDDDEQSAEFDDGHDEPPDDQHADAEHDDLDHDDLDHGDLDHGPGDDAAPSASNGGVVTDDGSLASLAAALDAVEPADWSRGADEDPGPGDDATPASEEQQLRFGTNPLGGTD
jgi:DivIVA domain-containing protein